MKTICETCVKPLRDAGMDFEVYTIVPMGGCDNCGAPALSGADRHTPPYKMHAVSDQTFDFATKQC